MHSGKRGRKPVNERVLQAIVMRVGRDFYRIKQDDGGFSLRRVHMGYYDGYVKALSIEKAKNSSIESLHRRFSNKPPDPVLVEGGYKGFNLIHYGEKLYAIPQSEGAFQIKRVMKNKYSQWFSGNSSEELRNLVDASGMKK